MTSLNNQPTTRLLDVSRLVSRASKVLTGIDRVELAYLKAVHDDVAPALALARTALGYLLLDKQGMQKFLGHLVEDRWLEPDLLSRLNPRLSPAARIGQTTVRKLAIDRAVPRQLGKMLARRSDEFRYINVGHSNLSERVLKTLKGSRITIMLHDAIPLDFPQYQRDGSVYRFKALTERVSRHADQVICITEAERERVAFHLEAAGRCPPQTVAHLGSDKVTAGDIPKGLADRPFFMTVGTIEPRKNHNLLLDVWERLGDDAPHLLICGARGWKNEAVFDRLDRGVANVVEVPDLSDEALRALMEKTQGFLFPSFAEGFGLPPVEAAMAGAPILCANLPSCREILGSKPVYLDPTDSYQWEKEVRALMRLERSGEMQPFVPPTWEAHFKTVFTIT